MVKPLNWHHELSMVRDGKGVCSVILGNYEIARTGNDTPNGISLRSGSISAIHQAIKRLESTIREMEQTAAQIEKFGLDTSK
jgi:hypothetical protein